MTLERLKPNAWRVLLAGLALAGAGAAGAQPTVALYGRIDAALQLKSKTGTAKQGLQVNSGGLNMSRWGLRGSEDLGGGLKANVQLESGFSADTGEVRGASNLFSRMAFVSVSGGLGTVSAGLQWTPYDNGFPDALEYTNASAMLAAFFPGAHGDKGNTGWGNAKNSLQYATPTLGGFNATFMAAPGEDGGPGLSASRYTGMGLFYKAGPVYASLALESSKQVGTGAPTNAWILGGSYKLDAVTLFAAVERARNKTLNGGEDAGWSVGASVPLGADTTLAASHAQESTSQATGSVVNADRRALGLRLVNHLSKRTNVYAAYLRTHTTLVAGSPSPSISSTLSLGLRHNF